MSHKLVLMVFTALDTTAYRWKIINTAFGVKLAVNLAADMQNKMWKNSKMESLLAKFSIWCNNKNNFNSSVTCTNNKKLTKADTRSDSNYNHNNFAQFLAIFTELSMNIIKYPNICSRPLTKFNSFWALPIPQISWKLACIFFKQTT